MTDASPETAFEVACDAYAAIHRLLEAAMAEGRRARFERLDGQWSNAPPATASPPRSEEARTRMRKLAVERSALRLRLLSRLTEQAELDDAREQMARVLWEHFEDVGVLVEAVSRALQEDDRSEWTPASRRASPAQVLKVVAIRLVTDAMAEPPPAVPAALAAHAEAIRDRVDDLDERDLRWHAGEEARDTKLGPVARAIASVTRQLQALTVSEHDGASGREIAVRFAEVARAAWREASVVQASFALGEGRDRFALTVVHQLPPDLLSLGEAERDEHAHAVGLQLARSELAHVARVVADGALSAHSLDEAIAQLAEAEPESDQRPLAFVPDDPAVWERVGFAYDLHAREHALRDEIAAGLAPALAGAFLGVHGRCVVFAVPGTEVAVVLDPAAVRRADATVEVTLTPGPPVTWAVAMLSGSLAVERVELTRRLVPDPGPGTISAS